MKFFCFRLVVLLTCILLSCRWVGASAHVVHQYLPDESYVVTERSSTFQTSNESRFRKLMIGGALVGMALFVAWYSRGNETFFTKTATVGLAAGGGYMAGAAAIEKPQLEEVIEEKTTVYTRPPPPVTTTHVIGRRGPPTHVVHRRPAPDVVVRDVYHG